MKHGFNPRVIAEAASLAEQIWDKPKDATATPLIAELHASLRREIEAVTGEPFDAKEHHNLWVDIHREVDAARSRKEHE